MQVALVLGGLALCLGLAIALRGGLRSRGRTRVIGLDAGGMVMSAAAVALAMYLFGPLFGLALTSVIVLHEFGHVAAFRAIGHADARFRLIPLLGGVAISDRPPGTPVEAAFVALMGPAIGIGPMLLAIGLAPAALQLNETLGHFLLSFASVSGALNLLNLLPVWPLDGGRLAGLVGGAFWPPLPLLIGAASAALLMILAVALGSILLGVLAIVGLQNLIVHGADEMRAPGRQMPRGQALLVLAAWGTTAAALYFGGRSLISQIL